MSSAGVIDGVNDDVAYWRARAEAEQAETRLARAHLAYTRERLVAAEARIEELAEQVATLSRILFGRSSEKQGVGDLGPDVSAGQEDEPEDDQSRSAGSGGRPRRGQRPGGKGHGRRDYSHLPTEERLHDVPGQERVCGACGVAFEPLGAESSEQLDWEVIVKRIVHRRLRYRRRCACAGCPRTVTAPTPPKPISKGLFTAAFLARLLYDKYLRGLPVQRIVQALAAEGCEVAEGTISGALKAVHALLAPLDAAIRVRNADAVHLHVDETSWRVFEQVEGKTGHRWWLWVFVAEDTVAFVMDPTRSAVVVEAHLGIDRSAGRLAAERRLVLSSDFYTVYQSMGLIDGVDPLWCWAHIRRYFLRAGDAHKQLRTWRDLWIERIAVLYLAHRDMGAAQVEGPAYREASAAFTTALTEIDTARQDQSALPGLHPAAAKVLATLNREWDGLVRHRDFPDLPLDNNTAERALRTPVVGRKNFYGSQAVWAADLAARVWTITTTAQRNGHEPLAFLTAYLTACADAGGKAPEGAALDRFLCWRPDPGDPTGSRDDDPPTIDRLPKEDHRITGP